MPKAKSTCNNSQNSQCNLPCERIFLQHNISVPSNGTATLTFIATNTSGKNIRSPIMLVSSLLGVFVFSHDGIEAGQTKKLTKIYTVQSGDYQRKSISNVSFLARAVPTGTPNTFTAGSRLSSVVKEQIAFPDNLISVNAVISTGPILTLTISNLIRDRIDTFNTDLSSIIAPGSSLVIQPGGNGPIFDVIGSNLFLRSGQTIGPERKVSVILALQYTYACSPSCSLTFNASSRDRLQSGSYIVIN